MKRCIGSAKPHRTVFRFFERYYDAKEVIHKRISWNWENVSQYGPKVRPIIMKNWIFNEKVHRICTTSQNRRYTILHWRQEIISSTIEQTHWRCFVKKLFYAAKFAHFFDKNNRIFKKITFNPGTGTTDDALQQFISLMRNCNFSQKCFWNVISHRRGTRGTSFLRFSTHSTSSAFSISYFCSQQKPWERYLNARTPLPFGRR